MVFHIYFSILFWKKYFGIIYSLFSYLFCFKYSILTNIRAKFSFYSWINSLEHLILRKIRWKNFQYPALTLFASPLWGVLLLSSHTDVITVRFIRSLWINISFGRFAQTVWRKLSFAFCAPSTYKSFQDFTRNKHWYIGRYFDKN